MRVHFRLWAALVALAILAPIAVLPTAKAVCAQGVPPVTDQELAQTFSPILYFHAAEVFRPQSVDVMLDTARLRQARRNWFDTNVLPDVSIPELLGYRGERYALDAWYGDKGASDYSNYSAHRAYYQAVLSPEAGGPPVVTYAHIVRDEDPRHITIQYWLFYYYNDWFNKHEGDWEMVQVMLSAAGEPEGVVLSQHHGGTRRPWGTVQVEEGTHPAVYVALGSHANYFWGDETYANGTTIGNARLEIMDRTGTFARTVPEVILIPDRDVVEADPSAWQEQIWLLYNGHWGELAPQSDFSGPFGPADKGDQWKHPHAWGLAQPLDIDTWYANRLRVAVAGKSTEGVRVTLQDANGNALPSAETLGNVGLLHADPLPDTVIVADILVPADLPYDLVARWPEPETSEVIHYRFDDVKLNALAHASLRLRADEPPVLSVGGGSQELRPTTAQIERVTWDAPDLVWLVGALPAGDVVKGIATSLLAGVLPTLLYVGLLYWADRYEKEPKLMLASAFLWGALPALLAAVAVQLFFRLPVDLLGPKALETVRAGLVAPLVEEVLKGMAVLYIASRYRLEFDNVLDGIIYGAMVGFGFAMTGNIVSYLGAFLLRGFGGLSSTIFVEGVLYGLNQALYTAIVGAGLGYARLARQRWQCWAIPCLAFLLAVAAHALHNLAIDTAVGLNPLTISATWLGVLVIIVVIVWSLRRQRQCLVEELIGEVPDRVYRALVTRGGQSRSQWLALRRGGLRGWQRARHTHQQCAELAFKKMQHRRRPDDPRLPEEIRGLREIVRQLVNAEQSG